MIAEIVAATITCTSTALTGWALHRTRTWKTRTTQTQNRLVRAEWAAHHDSLTYLPNRAALAADWPTHAGTHIAILDLDGFKTVNDVHGHAAGDWLLATLAARMDDELCPCAPYRLGGDEFAVIVTDPTDLDSVLALLAFPVELPSGVELAVGISVGLAAWRPQRPAVLKAADQAMYAHKRR